MDHTATFGDVGHVIREAVEQPDLPFSFRELLLIPLSQPGKVLSCADRPFWPALVLAGSDATGGCLRAAVRLAAATEIFIAATDVLDELEDGDDSPLMRAAGPAQSLNAASALMMLSHEIMPRLQDDGALPERVLSIISTFTSRALLASAGQHRDLTADSGSSQTLDDALDIARHKAGTLAGMACRLGAMLGTDDSDSLALFEEFGSHLGVIGQLDNDLRDARNSDTKSDQAHAKNTLALLYDRDTSRSALDDQAALAATPTVETGGATHFVWVVMEIERQAARRVLAMLSARGQSIERLGELLD